MLNDIVAWLEIHFLPKTLRSLYNWMKTGKFSRDTKALFAAGLVLPFITSGIADVGVFMEK